MVVRSPQTLASNIIRLHRLPNVVRSDRDMRLISQPWRLMCSTLGMQHRPTTLFRPSGNGNVERVNRMIGEQLRIWALSRPSSSEIQWDDALPSMELCINSRTLRNTKLTPFWLTYGCHPTTFADLQADPETFPHQTGGNRHGLRSLTCNTECALQEEGNCNLTLVSDMTSRTEDGPSQRG